jgi:hypothetical protein
MAASTVPQSCAWATNVGEVKRQLGARIQAEVDFFLWRSLVLEARGLLFMDGLSYHKIIFLPPPLYFAFIVLLYFFPTVFSWMTALLS